MRDVGGAVPYKKDTIFICGRQIAAPTRWTRFCVGADSIRPCGDAFFKSPRITFKLGLQAVNGQGKGRKPFARLLFSVSARLPRRWRRR